MKDYIIIILVSLGSSVVGGICGIGGGVIIKPVLDAAGIIPVNTISFLSGCTVLSMSVISVFKHLTNSSARTEFDKRIATALAVGAVLGGFAGKSLYERILQYMPSADKIGAIQAVVLLLITAGTLLYTLNKNKITTLRVHKKFICVTIGMVLGLMSAFLGIGGGPINLVMLFFFFSLETKQAAVYSLYIIMFSQTSSLLSSIVSNKIPEFSPFMIILMACCGIGGGLVGSFIHQKARQETVDRLFIGLMSLIILINMYNIRKYI